MKAKKTFIENEKDGKMNWGSNSGSLIAVVNKDQKNKYGEYPGWRIAPGEFFSKHLELLNCSTMEADHLC